MEATLTPYWIDGWARNYTILVDTCSVMQKSFQAVVKAFSAPLKNYHKKLIVPECVISELKKFVDEDSERGDEARLALSLIYQYRAEELINIRTGITQGFRPDEYFLSYAPNRVHEKIMFITQDFLLAKDILAFNDSGSCLGHYIKVKRIDRFGELKNFDITRTVDKPTVKPKTTNAGEILRQLGY